MVLNSVESEILENLSDGELTIFSKSTPEESAALSRLLDRGFVERRIGYPDNNFTRRTIVYRITSSGLMALQDHEEAEHRRADQPTDKSQRDNARKRKVKSVMQWFAGILGAAIAALLAAWIARRLGW